jgi:hypothetical protein
LIHFDESVVPLAAKFLTRVLDASLTVSYRLSALCSVA